MTTDEKPATGPGLSTSVGKTAARLQDSFFGAHGDRAQARARATLADLRRNAGKTAASDPLAMENVLLELNPPLGESLLGKGDRPSPSEDAAFAAISFFALHMQSAKRPMHVPDVSFARACGLLDLRSDSDSLKPRFDAILLTQDLQAQVIHIRSLIQLLRREELGFDYGRFALDLRSLHNPLKRNGVLVRWSRDFATAHYSTTGTTAN
ncbi:type I-E CRISPR-associated protein Cse2/CasB [Corynebacterium sp. HMSC073D01]|uniref:type I-E CRISPR-associated protein Cse2/CasB n=1 Tax=Corynebacterium sp. HMSC073D01 TaxID=1739536 RepID=UPI0008A3F5D7|nr:type I-E CRISPR-associated protein Cse2/CasB [Corynebacterium sp. HMSC073D01]OFO45006.1 type I-E CRISPR-associated protein Cse2/CasB [Corynebacterium sp. HMSC073D01]